MRNFTIGLGALILAACGGIGPDSPTPPEAPAPPSTTTDAGDLILPPTPPETSDGAGVPPLSEVDYTMRDISELGLTGEENMADIGALLEAKFGIDLEGEGNPSQSLRIVEDGANVTIVFEVEGFTDDSVKGEQHVVEAFLPAGTWTPVTGYGVRHKCWRGNTPDVWTKKPCS